MKDEPGVTVQWGYLARAKYYCPKRVRTISFPFVEGDADVVACVPNDPAFYFARSALELDSLHSVRGIP